VGCCERRSKVRVEVHPGDARKKRTAVAQRPASWLTKHKIAKVSFVRGMRLTTMASASGKSEKKDGDANCEKKKSSIAAVGGGVPKRDRGTVKAIEAIEARG